jgi:hypothetical protein
MRRAGNESIQVCLQPKGLFTRILLSQFLSNLKPISVHLFLHSLARRLGLLWLFDPPEGVRMMGKGVGEALLMRPFLFRPCSEHFGLPPYKSKVDGCPFHSRNLCMHPHATHNTLESN